MNIKRFTVKSKILWFLLPLFITVLIIITFTANQILTNVLQDKFNGEKETIISNASLLVEQIHAGYAMLDLQLEDEMAEGIKAFKILYEQETPKLSLPQIKKAMNDKYNLIVIDQKNTIIESTIEGAAGFNFTEFDKALGEKISDIRKSNEIIHEKIRTNVGTGLLSKFSYLATSDNKNVLEIVYDNDQFSKLVNQLEPVKTMDKLTHTYESIKSIKIYDAYGYEFKNDGTKTEPSEMSLIFVKRAKDETRYEEKQGNLSLNYIYIEDHNISPLSDQSKVLEIVFDDTMVRNLIIKLSVLVFLGGALIALFSTVIIYYGVQKITTPISMLYTAALSVSKGNYEVYVKSSGEDEIAQLTNVFNNMTSNIRNAYNLVENKLKTTLYSVGDGIIAVSLEGKIEIFNREAEKIIGYKSSEVVGKSLEEVFFILRKETLVGIDKEFIANVMGKSTETIKNRYGNLIPIEMKISEIRADSDLHQGVVIIFRDITNHIEKMNQIEFLSYNDQLTEVYNRRYFDATMLKFNDKQYLPLTMVMIDVNGLKLINDAFGHSSGDKLLKAAASVMKKYARNEDVLSRIGGDEFVFLMPCTSEEEAEALMKALLNDVSEMKIENMILSLSYGIATHNDAETSLFEIFKIAEDHMYRRKLSESLSMRYQMIEVVMKTLYEKNEREKLHSERVSTLSALLGTALGLEPDEIKELRSAGLMHDIGKIAIDLSLLDKPSDLTKAERLEIERHPEVGYQMLKSINEFTRISEIVLAHHEHWDGTGYPRNLKGKEIPFYARIVAIADFYDAMSTDRPYRKALVKEDVLQALKVKKGTDFDPELVDIFIDTMNKN